MRIPKSFLGTTRTGEAAKRRSGGALVLALIAVMTVAFMAASFMQMSASVTRRQARAVDTKQAFYLAEAGLTEAYAGIMVGKTGNVGTQAAPAIFGQGLLWVEATELGDGMVELEATAMSGGGKSTLSLVVARGELSIGDLGIFALDDLTVDDGVVIDGYDSKAQADEEQELFEGGGAMGGITGAPDSGEGGLFGGGGGALPDPNGEDQFHGTASVGSNGNITVSSTPIAETQIWGSLTAGPRSAITTTGEPLITGVQGVAVNSVDLPSVRVPPVSQPGPLSHASGTTLVVAPGGTGYTTLVVRDDSEIVFEGPATIVVDDMTVRDGGQLTFDTTNGDVDIFVTGNILLDRSSAVAFSSKDPTRVTIQVSGLDSVVDLAAAGPFYGTVYAPVSTIDLGRSFEVFGVVVGRGIDMSNGSKLHCDRYLATLAKEEALPSLLSWRIIDFASLDPSNIAANPFDLLGVDPATLEPPHKAHKDQQLLLRYIDAAGNFQLYDGLESLFDWSNVDKVIGGSRDGQLANFLDPDNEGSMMVGR